MSGEVLGPYRLDAEIGSGGMGVVYRATVLEEVAGLRAGETVAVKVLHGEFDRRPALRKRFEREARLGREIRHPNVVRTYDSGSARRGDRPAYYLVMELVEGQTLRALIDEVVRLPEALCLHLAREVARGLAAIHAAGVVHRDLKPENVVVTAEQQVKVMDFGIAHLPEEVLTSSASGHLLGTLLYAAPEQFRRGGREVDGRTDLYALGVLLYEAAAGRHPYAERGVHAIVHEQTRKDARAGAEVLEDLPLGRVAPQVSPFFEEVVRALRARDRSARMASARFLAEVLEQGETSPWWRERSARRRRDAGSRRRRPRVPRETPLFGREPEMGLLRAVWDRVRSGRGQVVLIQGEAGVGKSRLVEDFADLVEAGEEPMDFLAGSFPPGGAATGAGAFVTALLERLGEEDLERDLAPHLRSAPLLVPALACFLRGEPPPPGETPLTRESVQAAFAHVLRSLAEERPVVLLVDDLHFAPEEGRALFASLAHSFATQRLLLVGTWRPGLPEEWVGNVQRLDHVTRIDLDRLGAADLVRLLRSALGSERLADDLAGRIAVLSDGNPFFAFEVLRGLREGRFLRRLPDGSWTSATEAKSITLPPSVRDLIHARIARLPEKDRDLLEVAACCGFEFDATLVGAVCRLGTVEVLKRLAQLERLHRLVRASGRRHVFDHHQVQEALYEGLSPLLREQYHAALAAELERTVRESGAEPSGPTALALCDHALSAGTGAGVGRWLDAALSHLEAQHRTEAGVDLAGRALGAVGAVAGAARVDLLLRRAAGLDLLGRRDEQRRSLTEALEAARALGDLSREAAARRRLGFLGYSTARYDEAKADLEAARETARRAGDAREEAAATGLLGSVAADQGDFDTARSLWERHLEMALAADDVPAEARATGNLGFLAYYRGDFAEALRLQEESHRLFRRCSDLWGQGRSTMNVGLVLQARGELEEARRRYEEALAVARQLGDRRGVGLALGNLGVLYRDLGLYRLAVEVTTENLENARAIEDRRIQATYANNLGRCWLDLGARDLAKERLTESLRLSEQGDRRERGISLQALAELDQAEGRLAEAEEGFRRTLALREELDQPAAVAETCVALGRLLLLRERRTEAVACLRRAAETGPGAQFPTPHVLALALLTGTDPGEVLAASAALAELGHRMPALYRLEAQFLLWRATADPTRLADCRARLGEILANAPEEAARTAEERVALFREIRDACAARSWPSR